MRNKTDIIIVVLLIASSVFLIWEARDYPGYWGEIPGPAFLPRIILIILICLSVLLMVQALQGKIPEKEKLGRIGLVGVSAIISFLYLYLAPRIHYFVATPIFLIVMMRLLGTRSWKRIFIISACFTIFVFLFFYKKLSVPLP
ncbi:MAG: tripartite tricarboxylate transporter TctB family protein [Patescibacteria group bacterium]